MYFREEFMAAGHYGGGKRSLEERAAFVVPPVHEAHADDHPLVKAVFDVNVGQSIKRVVSQLPDLDTLIQNLQEKHPKRLALHLAKQSKAYQDLQDVLCHHPFNPKCSFINSERVRR